MKITDSTRRFSSRVEAYVRYRPGYPPQLLDALCERGVLRGGAAAATVVADVGSGTGILSESFLRRGCSVFGVEPNAEMRAAAERALPPIYGDRFVSVPAAAEATTLPDASVDLVAAGQAFHWFDPARSRAEFTRILRPAEGGDGGWVALVWNERLLDATPFLADYERLLHAFCADYAAVSESYPTAGRIQAFFGRGDVTFAKFPNRQSFDFESLRGRLLSSSYAAGADSPQHGPMLAELRTIFDRHAEGGQVHFDYDAVLYLGQLRPVGRG